MTANSVASLVSLHFCGLLCLGLISSLAVNLHKPDHFHENLIQTINTAFCTIFPFFPCFPVDSGSIWHLGKW